MLAGACDLQAAKVVFSRLFLCVRNIKPRSRLGRTLRPLEVLSYSYFNITLVNWEDIISTKRIQASSSDLSRSPHRMKY